MSKKLVLSLSSIVLIIGIVVGVTYAYFTADTTAANVVTIGNVQIEAKLADRVLNADGINTGEPFDVDGVVIRNKGNTHCYIRVQLVPENLNDMQYYDKIEVIDSRGNLMPLSRDDNGNLWYHYKNRLDSKDSVTFSAKATITSGVADQLSQVRLKYYVEAIQYDHIDIGLYEYPTWPNVEIKKYNG